MVCFSHLAYRWIYHRFLFDIREVIQSVIAFRVPNDLLNFGIYGRMPLAEYCGMWRVSPYNGCVKLVDFSIFLAENVIIIKNNVQMQRSEDRVYTELQNLIATGD